jgi:hypothetical protein
MFFNPKVALQSILRTATGGEDSQPLPTKLVFIREESMGRHLVNLAEVVAQVQKLEIKALSPDTTLPLEAPLSWLAHVPHPLDTPSP